MLRKAILYAASVAMLSALCLAQDVYVPNQGSDDMKIFDLLDPSDEERSWAGEIFGQPLPSPDSVAEIEMISRFF